MRQYKAIYVVNICTFWLQRRVLRICKKVNLQISSVIWWHERHMRRRFLLFTTGNFTFLSRGEGIFNAHKARGLSANVALLRGAAAAARSFSNPVSTTTLFPKNLCKRASARSVLLCRFLERRLAPLV